MPRFVITPEQRALMRKLHAEGLSQTAIARVIGCNQTTVGDRLRGYVTRVPTGAKRGGVRRLGSLAKSQRVEAT
jgi:hypothetical protein